MNLIDPNGRAAESEEAELLEFDLGELLQLGKRVVVQGKVLIQAGHARTYM